MAELDSFLPLIRGRLPGCPDIVLKDGVRDACIEFCRRTELLSANVDVSVVANQSHYQLLRAVWGTWGEWLATPEYEFITSDGGPYLTADGTAGLEGVVAWEVVQLRRASQRLTPANRQEFQLQGWDVAMGTPGYYYLEGDGSLVLGPIPDADETLVATLSVTPGASSANVPDALWYDHREAIAAGARAWVRRNLGDWVNPQLEAEDRKVFEYAIHNQNIRRARGGANAALRVRAQPF